MSQPKPRRSPNKAPVPAKGHNLNPRQVAWINGEAKQPLCDIPWFGFSLVLSNGDLNYCCYTPAIAGNVNEETFEQIWQGNTMQRIRRELSEQRLPPECRTTSCPINRGDSHNFIVARLENTDPNNLPHPEKGAQLEKSFIRFGEEKFQAGDVLDLSIGLRCRGEPLSADLFVAIQQPSGSCRFLPEYDDYAVPFQTGMTLQEKTPLDINVRTRLGTAGTYQICAALFAPGSNPNMLANCYWSQIESVTVG